MSKLFNKFSYFNIATNGVNNIATSIPIATNGVNNIATNMPIATNISIATNIPIATNVAPLSEKKSKKKTIPKHIKTLIWNKYIGEDIIKHRCLCCKKETIKNTDFEAGHVLSVFNGGTNELDNLRPICRPCNASMGTMHMVEYIKMYGLYI